MPDFAKLYNNLTIRNNVFSGYLFFNSNSKYTKTVRYIGVLNWVYAMVILRIIIFILLNYKIKAIIKIKR